MHCMVHPKKTPVTSKAKQLSKAHTSHNARMGEDLIRIAQSSCVNPFHRLTSVSQPVLVTGVVTLHRLLPCASLRSPPVLYIPQATDVPAAARGQ
jgi:hypothetical protein